MLGNNEPIQGVDLPEVFSAMVGELPWRNLKAFAMANPQLSKRCTAGGHRLEPKKRKRIEKILFQEAEKEEYSQAFTNGVFAHWYPVHEDLHKRLEDYFHSDEYEEYREGKELEEDTYVLPDDVFGNVFRVEELPQWRVLLCFSPLQFTQEQADKVLKGEAGSETLVARVQELEEKIAALEKERDSATNELTRAQAEQQKAGQAAQTLRRERRELAAEARSLQNKFDSSQAENKSMRTKMEEIEQELYQRSASVESQSKQAVDRLKTELETFEGEMGEWRTRYENQCNEYSKLDEKHNELQRAFRNQKKKLDESYREMDRLGSYAELILDHIDWPKVGAQMKLTSTLKRQFNNLIRSLNYEDDRTLTIEGTLPDFWKRMQVLETKLIDAICESNTREVAEGDVEEYWRGLTDDFEDVYISLEGRAVLLRMLQDIFYQTLEMRDLETPKIPRPRR